MYPCTNFLVAYPGMTKALFLESVRVIEKVRTQVQNEAALFSAFKGMQLAFTYQNAGYGNNYHTIDLGMHSYALVAAFSLPLIAAPMLTSFSAQLHFLDMEAH